MRASITIPTDADGYLGFQCAHCRGDFKLRADSFRAFPGTTLTCPLCGFESGRNEMWPSDVIAAARAEALNAATGYMNDAVSGLARKHSVGIVSMKFKPFPKKHVPKVVAIPELVETSVECCGESIKLPLHAAASLFYCPFCRTAHH